MLPPKYFTDREWLQNTLLEGTYAMITQELAALADRSEARDVNVDCHGFTHTGKVRPSNEDQFLIAELKKSMVLHRTSMISERESRCLDEKRGHFLAVADGLGGHAAGWKASEIAIGAILRQLVDVVSLDIQRDLSTVFERCHAMIRSSALQFPEFRGMGTTLTLTYVLWPALFVAHVGDSRCYLIRSSRIERITTDHTRAQQLVALGVLKPEDTEQSRLSHALWNVVGGNSDDLSPEVRSTELATGDTLLLCTDGLTKHLTDQTIAESIAGRSAKQSCNELVDAANRSGGTDNITVVVARFL